MSSILGLAPPFCRRPTIGCVRAMLRIAIPLALAELGWMVGRLPDSAVSIGAASVGNALFYAFAIFCLGLMSSNKVSGIGSNPTAFSRSRIDVAHALSVPCRDFLDTSFSERHWVSAADTDAAPQNACATVSFRRLSVATNV